MRRRDAILAGIVAGLVAAVGCSRAPAVVTAPDAGAAIGAPSAAPPAPARSRMTPAMVQARTSTAVAMVGDSHVQLGDWPRLLGREGVAQHGIGGQTSGQVLARIGPIAAARPRVLVLVVGSNDVLQGRSTADTLRDVGALLDAIAAASPETRTIVTSVLPLDAARLRVRVQPRQIDRLNADLHALIESRGARWLDLHPLVRGPEGGFIPAMTSDGLHLSAAGYRVWADALGALLP